MESIRNKNILIVDDDEYMLRALDKTLTGEGAVVTRTQWAGDAVEILIGREKNMDMVITDLRMPFVTGMTLVYAIRLMFPSIPAVVLTAYGSPEMKAECFRQGATAVLEKNLSTLQLLAEIEKVLTKHEPGVSSSSKPETKAATDEGIHPDKIAEAHDQDPS
jgi:DNA-binding NtrC family response regulator